MKTVYKLDKIEPEPKGMILKVFIFGCLSTIPAGWIEGFLINSVLSYMGLSIDTNESDCSHGQACGVLIVKCSL